MDVLPADRTLNYPVRANSAFDTFTCNGRSCDGLELTLEVAAGQAFDVHVADLTPGLPAEGATLLAARPATAVPVHDGDMTVVTNLVRIGAGD